MNKTVNPGRPQTLMQAHEELVRIRPCRTASLSVWLSYYQHSAQAYERIAKTDPTGHDLEAMYWAQRERAHARDIEVRMRGLGLDE
jgi:hypothetical protein